ncbi:hypothetical protein Cal7507_2617 [Calothrix sp. PCC 7507]|nr:hypothetical protein Cal7507_2617 [Calothrix sp. PCC 7507]
MITQADLYLFQPKYYYFRQAASNIQNSHARITVIAR